MRRRIIFGIEGPRIEENECLSLFLSPEKLRWQPRKANKRKSPARLPEGIQEVFRRKLLEGSPKIQLWFGSILQSELG